MNKKFENITEYGPNDLSFKKGVLKKTPVILCDPEGASHLLSEGRTLVFLIRHGQTDCNLALRLQGRENYELNQTGIEQAYNCAALIKNSQNTGIGISKVYSSPLSRAKVTADIISNTLDLGNSIIEEGLTERDYGELSGLTLDERRAKFPKGERQAKNVESVPCAAFRMKKELVSLTKESTEKKAVIAVTHGGIINALFLKITNGRVGTGKNLSENCGISLVAVNKKTTIPLAYNLTGNIFLDYTEKLCRSMKNIGNH